MMIRVEEKQQMRQTRCLSRYRFVLEFVEERPQMRQIPCAFHHPFALEFVEEKQQMRQIRCLPVILSLLRM